MAETCRSCGSAIVWVEMESGKKMPLDAEPVAFVGNVLTNDKATGRVLSKEQIAVLPPGSKLYRSHFATCPNANKHRKPKEK